MFQCLEVNEGKEVKLGRNDFNRDDISPERLGTANQVWVSPIRTVKALLSKVYAAQSP